MATKPKQTIDWTPIFTYLDKNFATKQDIQELKEAISHLPTKEEYYTTMDKWMKATSTHDIEKSAHKNAHKRIEDHLNFSHAL